MEHLKKILAFADICVSLKYSTSLSSDVLHRISQKISHYVRKDGINYKFYICHPLVLIAIIEELITVKNKECLLHILFWQHVSIKHVNLQANNIKSINVFYAILLNDINN
jgi:hypothetical protein